MTTLAPFSYRDGELHCEDVPAERIAEEHGTPCYVYSSASLVDRFRSIRDAFARWDALVCFSVKSCGNLSVLRLLAEEGSGFDVISGGELYRVLTAGGDPARIVYAGPGKTSGEIEYALREGISLFDVESRPELEAINEVACQLGTQAHVALRVNPDVDPHTHEKTTTGKGGTKFGIDMDQAEKLALESAGWGGVEIKGIHFHLGSPIYSTAPYEQALGKVVALLERLRGAGCPVECLNIGGGFCISYTGEQVTSAQEFAAAVESYLEKSACPVIIIEPGRYIAGNSAVLLTRAVYRKETGFGKRYLICDAAMNDLVRPTLYGAFHRIWPVRSARGMPDVVLPEQQGFDGIATEAVDIVGPVCESGDFLAKDRALPPVEAGELLAVFDVGAYGFTMSSNYNARPRAAEVLVDGKSSRLVRRRETYGDLVDLERELLK
ncbi:MAG: diaminopimelate decarboxylase [Planctomycetota bacterium]